MAPLDSANMSETIAKFMLISQERALDQKINSFQETIATLQERYNQEIKALQATIASHQDRHEQETKATREVIAHIQDRHKALHGAITSLQDQYDECNEETSSLRETVKSLQSFAKQAEAVQTKLQNENAELRAQLSHTEGSTKKSEPSRTRRQEEGRSRRPNEPRQIIAQLQEPRGVKRAHVDDAADPPRRAIPAQAEKESRESRRPPRFTMSKDRSVHTRAHDDEGARREEKRQSQAEARAAAHKQELIDYVKSIRDEYTPENYGRDQRAFICRFIDGIKDPVLSRWVQEALKARFPEKIHDEKRSARKAGGRIVGPTRELTWKDVETVLKYTPWPSLTEWSGQCEESDDMTAQEE